MERRQGLMICAITKEQGFQVEASGTVHVMIDDWVCKDVKNHLKITVTAYLENRVKVVYKSFPLSYENAVFLTNEFLSLVLTTNPGFRMEWDPTIASSDDIPNCSCPEIATLIKNNLYLDDVVPYDRESLNTSVRTKLDKISTQIQAHLSGATQNASFVY